MKTAATKKSLPPEKLPLNSTEKVLHANKRELQGFIPCYEYLGSQGSRDLYKVYLYADLNLTRAKKSPTPELT